jgi:hypothetical protein
MYLQYVFSYEAGRNDTLVRFEIGNGGTAHSMVYTVVYGPNMEFMTSVSAYAKPLR